MNDCTMPDSDLTSNNQRMIISQMTDNTILNIRFFADGNIVYVPS